MGASAAGSLGPGDEAVGLGGIGDPPQSALGLPVRCGPRYLWPTWRRSLLPTCEAYIKRGGR